MHTRHHVGCSLKALASGVLVALTASTVLAQSGSQSFLIRGTPRSCSDITLLDSALTSGNQQFFAGWTDRDYSDAFAWSQACAPYGWHIPGQPRIPLLQAQRERALEAAAAGAASALQAAAPAVAVPPASAALLVVPAAAGAPPAAALPATPAATAALAPVPNPWAAGQAGPIGAGAAAPLPAQAAPPAGAPFPGYAPAAAAALAPAPNPWAAGAAPIGAGAGAPLPAQAAPPAGAPFPGNAPVAAAPTVTSSAALVPAAVLQSAPAVTSSAALVPAAVLQSAPAGAAASLPVPAPSSDPAVASAAVAAPPVDAAASPATLSAASPATLSAASPATLSAATPAVSSVAIPLASMAPAEHLASTSSVAVPPAITTAPIITPARADALAPENDEDSLLSDAYVKQHFHRESVWVASKANLDIGSDAPLTSSQMKNRITADRIVLYCARKANTGESGSNHPLLWDWRWCETEEAAAYNRLVSGNEFPKAGRAVLLGCASVESFVYLERCMQTLSDAAGSAIPPSAQ